MDLLRKAVELGLRSLAMPSENAEKITNELVKKGKLKRYESNSIIKDMIKKGEAQEKKIELEIGKMVKKTLLTLEIASKNDVRRLENEIKRLKAHKH